MWSKIMENLENALVTHCWMNTHNFNDNFFMWVELMAHFGGHELSDQVIQQQ